MFHTVYDSYEPGLSGRDYIGKHSTDNPNSGKTRTEEQRLKFQGENNGFYGKTHTEETRKIQSEKKQGENNPMYGRTGEDHPSFGRKDSDEVKRKKSEAAKRSWEQRKARGKTNQTEHD